MSLYKICKENTSLQEKEIEYLQNLESFLPLIADLTGSDVFIDVFTKNENVAIVAAQEKSRFSDSLYDRSVIGMVATEDDEPAVYSTMENKIPIKDLRALTQEGSSVRQDVVPIFYEKNFIGVLVREKDISLDLQRDKKFNTMAKHLENETAFINSNSVNTNEILMQEVNHRVKNSLQMVTSILRIQARQCSDPEVKKIFNENVCRVLSIASTHDIISHNEKYDKVSVKAVIEQVVQNLRVLTQEQEAIDISVAGDDVVVGTDIASSVALVVNELLTNAIKYAFKERKKGKIRVVIQKGKLYTTVLVEDDGQGFDVKPVEGNKHLGLRLAKITVEDKLKGTLNIQSSPNGTIAMFDLKMPV